MADPSLPWPRRVPEWLKLMVAIAIPLGSSIAVTYALVRVTENRSIDNQARSRNNATRLSAAEANQATFQAELLAQGQRIESLRKDTNEATKAMNRTLRDLADQSTRNNTLIEMWLDDRRNRNGVTPP